MTSSPLSESLSAASSFGRYFSLVSTASSTVLVVFVFALIRSGAFGGRPSLMAVADAITALTLGDVALLTFASLIASLTIHPFQYALVQFLEGYWGSRRLAVRAMASAAATHRDRIVRYESEIASAQVRLTAVEQAFDPPQRSEDPRIVKLRKAAGKRLLVREHMTMGFLRDEAQRLRDKYPADEIRVLPTALGNRLRRGEDSAGVAWGIDVILAAPHISLVADERDDSYLEDATSELDTSLRFCLIWALCTVLSTVALWRHGTWLVVPAATYGLAYLSYRGALVAADEHGVALATLVDLNRFEFYRRMGIPMPLNTTEERLRNRQLKALLSGAKDVEMTYAPATRREDIFAKP